jgi:Zn ribbon nucleic-acid-binding protein
MPKPDRACVKCGGDMEGGFILDNTYGERRQSEWIEGAPERRRLTGIRLKGKRQLAIITFRCVRCGYLESYAPPA